MPFFSSFSSSLSLKEALKGAKASSRVPFKVLFDMKEKNFSKTVDGAKESVVFHFRV
jgi:hypothetical protein